MNRLIKKHPYLIKVDTIVVRDTIRDTINFTTELIRLDTVFSFNEIFDTITIVKDNLTVRYFHDTIHDKVYISGECDTIWIEVPYENIIEYKVPCDTVVVTPSSNWQRWLLLIVISVIVLWFIRPLISR
jgi:hypothetical protein